MSELRRAEVRLAGLLAILVLLLPMALYWAVIGRAPAVDADQARMLLTRADHPALLLDIRSASEYAEGHIAGAVHWPYSDILRVQTPGDLPPAFAAGDLLIYCDSGIRSALAARRLRALGVDRVRSVKGGLKAWIATGAQASGEARRYCRLRAASGEERDLPFRPSTKFEQRITVLAGFVVKPTYMALSLLLAAVLWRRRDADLLALRWSMVAFFVGEAFCALNYWLVDDQSVLFEYLHSVGMLFAMSLGVYAVAEGFDRRVVKLSATDERCAFLALCRGCIKHTDARCGLRHVFYAVLCALAVVCFLPLSASPHSVSYNTLIYGVPFNWSDPVVHQLYEIRMCPLMALALFAASFLVLLLKKSEPLAWSKVLFAAALGPFAFGYLRLMLFAPFRENLVWFSFWEEITELLGILAVGYLLWVFRSGLLPKRNSARWILPAPLVP